MDQVVMSPVPEKEINEGDPTGAPKAPIYKKESAIKTRKRPEKKGKIPGYRFKDDDYKTLEKYDEKLSVRQLNSRGQLVAVPTPTGRTLEREVLKPEFVRENGGLHQAKCKYRAAKFFDVGVSHLEKAYRLLAGKKIDGFWITDLIDRFGFSDGTQMSRAMLVARYKKTNRNLVDVAQEKLYDIVNSDDVTKTYVALVKDITEEFKRDLRDQTIYG